MNNVEKVKQRLDEIQKEETKKDKKYYEQMLASEEKRLEKEKRRRKLKDEEEKIQENFSNKVETDIIQSKKIFGFIKRYVLIGIVTGVPGIALTYLWDKLQESKIIKNLYHKNMETVINPNDRELAREYELLRRKFCRTYDIDKIEKLIRTSKEIDKLKNDNKELEKLSAEIKKCREQYEENLGNYIESQIENEKQEEIEDEEELEIRREDFYEVEGVKSGSTNFNNNYIFARMDFRSNINMAFRSLYINVLFSICNRNSI